MQYKTEDGIFAQISGGFGSAIILTRASCKFESIIKICKALKINTNKLKPNFTFLSKIYKDNDFLDEVLITYFKAPHSFTGEDCLEVAIHGSSFIFEELASVFVANGFRFANNGEFSYRAFLNGKIDLVEAEGIASLVDSSSKVQHLSAKRQFLGEASKVFVELKNNILEVLSFVESLIDFSDEELPDDVMDRLEYKINHTKDQIQKHLHNTSIISLQEGLKIAIIGRPNVGKSSIFNRFCGREKAIVSGIAGTTRDVLEERITLKGIPLYFYDTAGIRSSSDEVEMEGVKRAVETLNKSDIKILVSTLDAKDNFDTIANEFNLQIDENTIFVLNKSDIQNSSTAENRFCISAKTGEGFADLIVEIERTLEENFLPLIKEGLISNERQKQMLNKAFESLNRFGMHQDIELAGEDLRIASRSLEEIIGKIDVEDILGSIFSKFCIGK